MEKVKLLDSFVLDNEEHIVGDRVRLKNTVNGVKATALCNILKIKSLKEIQLQCVYDDAKVIASIDDLELM